LPDLREKPRNFGSTAPVHLREIRQEESKGAAKQTGVKFGRGKLAAGPLTDTAVGLHVDQLAQLRARPDRTHGHGWYVTLIWVSLHNVFNARRARWSRV
jgi:hypothetical protein